MNHAHTNENLCNRCAYAKDKVNNPYVSACFCTEYGYIVSHRTDRCRGYKFLHGEENENDGNVTGTDSVSS